MPWLWTQKAAFNFTGQREGQIQRLQEEGQDREEPQVPLSSVEDLEHSREYPQEYPLHMVFTIGKSANKPLMLNVELNGQEVPMEGDTGPAVSLVPEETFQKLWPQLPIKESNMRLQTYSGQPIAVQGRVEVVVNYGQQTTKLPLLVVEGDGPSLFGRNLLKHIKQYTELEKTTLDQVLAHHQSVLLDGLGTRLDIKPKFTEIQQRSHDTAKLEHCPMQ